MEENTGDIGFVDIESYFHEVSWDKVYCGQEVYIEGDDPNKFRAYGPFKVSSIERKSLKHFFRTFFDASGKKLLTPNANFDRFERAYAKQMITNFYKDDLGHTQTEWETFVGRTLIFGMANNFPTHDIIQYICMWWFTHRFNKDIPKDIDGVEKDIRDYIEFNSLPSKVQSKLIMEEYARETTALYNQG